MNWHSIEDRLKLNDASVVTSALNTLPRATSQISYVPTSTIDKLDHLTHWTYPFAAYQLIRDGSFFYSKSKTLEHNLEKMSHELLKSVVM